jgi:hypothetical protein
MISLKNVLLVNGVSSGVTGLQLIIFGNMAAGLFGVSQPQAFWGVGIFLVAFAILVIAEGLQQQARENRVRFIIVLDSLWVIASLVILVLQLFNLSAIGYVAITAVAAWVGLMAYLQMRELKKELYKA